MVLYGLLDGLKPIYVEEPRLQDVDPLFELSKWRERVSSPEDLSAALAEYAAVAAPRGDWEEAAGYVKEYVLPVTRESVKNFLSVLRAKS